jgi:outer membrane protein OmpA-like peptidoglycan-associated protein
VKSETTTSAQQLSDARAQAETSNNELTELKAQLESQQSTRLNAEQTLTEERDRLRSDLASRDEQLATLSQQSTRLNAEQTLTEERDQLRSDLASRDEQLATLNTELQTATDALQQAKSETNTSGREPTQAQAALTAAQSEVAAGETLEVDAVEVAALQIATPDADQDGVPDSIDLCLETQQGIAVESTGCAAGAAINLAGVNFGYNSHELTDEARRILDRVADILSQHADLHLQVAGHTDAQGDPAYNQWLSLQRAQAVRDYLVAQGVNSGHIGAAGYGGEQPIADNTTQEGMHMNRRVELRSAQ